MSLKTFKFLSNKRISSYRRFNIAALDPEHRNIMAEGYYDAFDCFTHGHDLRQPYNPLVHELEYELWSEGVRKFEENNSAE